MRPPKILVSLIFLVFIASISFAQQGEVAAVVFPYVAKITGNDVYVRSGPGSNYYRCGKLNKPDRVTVVAQEHSWSKILPPAGSFSWISTQYVKFDPDKASIGIVTGDNVRVWAGSIYHEPIHSTSLQTKLKTGDTVELLGEEKADYYKIVPPAGAYFYVSTEFAKYLGGVEEVEVPEVKVPLAPAEPERPAGPAVVPVGPSAKAVKLKEYYDLAEKVDLERKKPLSEQNYLELKQSLSAIASEPKYGKAARYADFQLIIVERFELAYQAGLEVQSQNEKLAQVLSEIRARRKAKLQETPDLGKFAAIGYLRLSQIYTAQGGKKRFVIVNDDGKIICYAQLQASAAGIDLTEFLNKKVGLAGVIEPDPQTTAALVRFVDATEIE